MSVLDLVADDLNPISVTIDFSGYMLGAKLSTKAREYFALNKDKYNIVGRTDEDLAVYFAHILFDRMRVEMQTEAIAAGKVAEDSTIESIRESISATAKELDELKLIKI